MTETLPQVEPGLTLEPDPAGFTTDTVAIPDNAGKGLTVETGIEIGIGLPGGASSTGELSGDDVVFEEVARDTDLVAQATDEGAAQILIVIDSAQAPTEFRFPVDVPEGASLRLNADGSASIAMQNVELGSFAAPWAVDADGAEVATRFVVRGETLVQIVDHTDRRVSYPVVADPKYSSSWWGYTIKLNTTEYKNLDAALMAGQGAAALTTALCASGVVTVPCALPTAIGGAVITLGRAALKACSNSKGVDIHTSKNFGLGGVVWCSGY